MKHENIVDNINGTGTYNCKQYTASTTDMNRES